MYASCNAEAGVGGYWLGMPYKLDIDHGAPLLKPKVGEIHLVLNHFGAGVFAHELQHFILDWMDIWGLGDSEAICMIVGRMTSQFWSMFYDNYNNAS